MTYNKYNISTGIQPEGHLHDDAAKRNLFRMIGAKKHVQNDGTKQNPEATRRRKHPHKENKKQDPSLTMPQKKALFLEKIAHERTSSGRREKVYILVEKMTHRRTSSRSRGRREHPYKTNDTKQYIEAAAGK
ncbi:hypothetical protein C922_05287 [Plasmodium inui San Antonio 1]|uniref:Uncharacterized protein n=1 Tax=Plasmodium inui San Antonio 1 TaxID=1237626 RepID=W6ZYB5_9APIC|nr:hypothetical protein C922_05287 [Plasmodium inui San Antonio 1]EUD64328.1 hypothetical protein C922_05287 [Plasmodium inui San Antonio 1]